MEGAMDKRENKKKGNTKHKGGLFDVVVGYTTAPFTMKTGRERTTYCLARRACIKADALAPV